MIIRLLKKIFLIVILFSCNLEKKESNKDLKKYKKQSNIEIFHKNDSINILKFNFHKNNKTLHLRNPKKLNFEIYFQQLEKSIETTKLYQIELNSIKTITMNFFLDLEEFSKEFSSIDKIQKEIINTKKEKRQFLNHNLIGKSLIDSKTIHRIISLLGIDSVKIKEINVEKCRSELIQSKESSIKNEHRLFCAHLIIYLK